jgi:hypothetical protein
LTVSLVATVSSTIATNLAIDADSNGVPYIVIDNTSGAHLYRTVSPTYLGNSLVFGAVDVHVSSDDKEVGVAGVSAASSTTYPAVRVWYNE